MTGPPSTTWFDVKDPTGRTSTGERGLRFSCTQCGNCCSGPPGYVRFTEAEAAGMAAAIGVTMSEFVARFTHDTPAGRSLLEVPSPAEGRGLDCVFLDRASQPGKALCRVYKARPAQCRTWPFWPENLKSPHHWARAARTCPGMNTGELTAPATIRVRLAEDIDASRAAASDGRASAPVD